MSNVKPGDFAKIVHPAAGEDYGKILHVDEPFDPLRLSEDFKRRHGALWWRCTLLSPINGVLVKQGVVIGGQVRSVGSSMPFPDAHLRRIDPPDEPSEDDNEQEHEADKEITA